MTSRSIDGDNAGDLGCRGDPDELDAVNDLDIPKENTVPWNTLDPYELDGVEHLKNADEDTMQWNTLDPYELDYCGSLDNLNDGGENSASGLGQYAPGPQQALTPIGA